jgi:hypothetical protein
MELISLKNLVEVHVTAALHIIYVNPLRQNHWLGLFVENRVVPILMKECPEPLIGAPLLA